MANEDDLVGMDMSMPELGIQHIESYNEQQRTAFYEGFRHALSFKLVDALQLEEPLSISEWARRSNVPARTIRRWIEIKRCKADRDENGSYLIKQSIPFVKLLKRQSDRRWKRKWEKRPVYRTATIREQRDDCERQMLALFGRFKELDRQVKSEELESCEVSPSLLT